MNYENLLITLRKLNAELNEKKANEKNQQTIFLVEQQLKQIGKEIKRIEGMRTYKR